jgi:hypothetical protein
LLFVDGAHVPARLLVNGTTVTQDISAGTVTYHHIALQRDTLLLADGHASLALVRQDGQPAPAVPPSAVALIWQRLADRAARLGFGGPIAAPPVVAAIDLLANGRRLPAISTAGGCHVFVVPAGVTAVALSASGCDSSDGPDACTIVRRIVIRSAGDVRDIPLDHPGLSDGWAPVERANGRITRRLSGSARLSMPDVTGPVLVEVLV